MLQCWIELSWCLSRISRMLNFSILCEVFFGSRFEILLQKFSCFMAAADRLSTCMHPAHCEGVLKFWAGARQRCILCKLSRSAVSRRLREQSSPTSNEISVCMTIEWCYWPITELRGTATTIDKMPDDFSNVRNVGVWWKNLRCGFWPATDKSNFQSVIWKSAKIPLP